MKKRNLRSNSGPQKVLQGTQKPKHSNVDDHLCTWDEIKGQFEKPGILIGNGASIAIWDKFKYDSLYKEAISTNHKWRLSNESRRIFKQLKTRNFERVLESLRLAV